MSEFKMDSFFTVWEPLQARYSHNRKPDDTSTFWAQDTATITMIIQALQKAHVTADIGLADIISPADGGRGGRRRYRRRSASGDGDDARGHDHLRISDHGDLEMSARAFKSGGMGKVFMGPNQTTGGWCAVKVPHNVLMGASTQSASELKTLFEDEALSWCGRWPHPFVVVPGGLTRIPRWENMPALILQYCPSGSLETRLADARASSQPISLQDAFAWAQQAALGLAAIHRPELDPLRDRAIPEAAARKGMTHCDIKPANLMIDADGAVRVSDLGLARVWAALPGDWRPDWDGAATTTTDARQQQATAAWASLGMAHGANRPEDYLRVNAHSHSTRIPRFPEAPEVGSEGAALGTPPFMPLEQWLGINNVTTASDVYALGIVLFELFAGAPGTPFEPDTATRNPYLQWYRGHQRGVQRRLTDDAMLALSHGPLSAMMTQRADRPYDAADSARARHVLSELDLLVQACVAKAPSDRPTAAAVANKLGDLAEQVRCLRVQVPSAFERNAANEAIFLRQLAATYGQLERTKEQHKLMLIAAHFAESDAAVQYGLGKSYMDLKQYDQALRTFATAELCLTSHQVAWATSLTYLIQVSKGAIYLKQGAFEQAIRAFESSLARQPEGVGALYNLALAYYRWADHAHGDVALRTSRLERGLEAVSDALEIEPDFPSARELQDALQNALEQIRVRQTPPHTQAPPNF